MAVCRWCGRATPTCACRSDPVVGSELPHDVLIDGNGDLTEVRFIGGHEVHLHFADIPDTDVTVLDGIPCTTALRTLIDIAPDYETDDVLAEVVADCLERRLFTLAEAWGRLREQDMRTRPGAVRLRALLVERSFTDRAS